MGGLTKMSYLIQRLDPPSDYPPDHAMAGLDNVFPFGAGYRNGGLTDEAMDLLRPIFRFDYMGAAEFEFGAVPKALGKIAERAEQGVLTAWSFSILYSKIKAPDCWRKGEVELNPPAPRSRAPLYAIGPAEWSEGIEERVGQLASKKPPHLKEWTNLDRVLRPTNSEYHPTTCGWLELDNGFFFFTDRTMWAKTAALFGVGWQ